MRVPRIQSTARTRGAARLRSAARFSGPTLLAVALLCGAGPRVLGGVPPDCASPLGEETLRNLVLQTGSTGARPGADVSFVLGVWECCVFVVRVPACVEWRISPPGLASIEELPFESEFGPSVRVTVSAEAPHGTVLTLEANVEQGRRVLSRELHVYTPEANPLVGYWREVEELPCNEFVRGDLNASGGIEITDAIRLLQWLFFGDARLACQQSADANRDQRLDLSDAVYLLNSLFVGGPPPLPPYPDCGADELSSLTCASYPRCELTPRPAPSPIEELVFHADGRFAVTWTPFEVYQDYWGEYRFGLDSGRLELELTGGNFIPDDVGCIGSCAFRVEIVEGERPRLTLEQTWLGTYDREDPRAAGCGHVFTR